MEFTNTNEGEYNYSFSPDDTKKKKHADKTGIKHKEFVNPFQYWSLEKLPSSRSYFLTDCDLIVRDAKGNMLIAELKAKSGKIAKMSMCQDVTYQVLDYALKSVNNTLVPIQINNYRTTTKINYKGYFKITMSGTRPDEKNSKIWVNGKLMSETDLIKLLSFID